MRSQKAQKECRRHLSIRYKMLRVIACCVIVFLFMQLADDFLSANMMPEFIVSEIVAMSALVLGLIEASRMD